MMVWSTDPKQGYLTEKGIEKTRSQLSNEVFRDELLSLYMTFEHVHQDDMDTFTRQEIYKLITCSIDIDNKMVMDLWKDYCRDYREMEELEFPYSPGDDLYDLGELL